jgi:hypothetical protein
VGIIFYFAYQRFVRVLYLLRMSFAKTVRRVKEEEKEAKKTEIKENDFTSITRISHVLQESFLFLHFFFFFFTYIFFKSSSLPRDETRINSVLSVRGRHVTMTATRITRIRSNHNARTQYLYH